jgi:hypothetical protein
MGFFLKLGLCQGAFRAKDILKIFVQSSSEELSIQEWLCSLLFPVKEPSLKSLRLLSQLPRFLVHQRPNLLDFTFYHPSFSYPFCPGKLQAGYLCLPLRSSGSEWEPSNDEAILRHNLEVQQILLNQNTHTSELPKSRTINIEGETRTSALFLGLAPELRGRAWRFSLPNTRLLILEADPIRSIRHSGRWYNCLRLANILELLPMICACWESLLIVRETDPLLTSGTPPSITYSISA